KKKNMTFWQCASAGSIKRQRPAKTFRILCPTSFIKSGAALPTAESGRSSPSIATAWWYVGQSTTRYILLLTDHLQRKSLSCRPNKKLRRSEKARPYL